MHLASRNDAGAHNTKAHPITTGEARPRTEAITRPWLIVHMQPDQQCMSAQVRAPSSPERGQAASRWQASAREE